MSYTQHRKRTYEQKKRRFYLGWYADTPTQHRGRALERERFPSLPENWQSETTPAAVLSARTNLSMHDSVPLAWRTPVIRGACIQHERHVSEMGVGEPTPGHRETASPLSISYVVRYPYYTGHTFIPGSLYVGTPVVDA